MLFDTDLASGGQRVSAELKKEEEGFEFIAALPVVMALARRRGVDDDASSTQNDSNGAFFSPGQEKKLSGGGIFHNREESVGGWIGGRQSLLGNAVKLFENVGDVVTNIVAPLDEDDESFDESDGYYNKWEKDSEEVDSWIEEKPTTQSHNETPLEVGTEETSLASSHDPSNNHDIGSLETAQIPRVVGNTEIAPLSAPSVDPRFLEKDESKLNKNNDNLGNISMDMDTSFEEKRSGSDNGSSIKKLAAEGEEISPNFLPLLPLLPLVPLLPLLPLLVVPALPIIPCSITKTWRGTRKYTSVIE